MTTKRRCAGCHAVIDGRPNRHYCSERCKKRGKRQREKGMKNVPLSGPVPTVVRGSNGALMAAVARLGYLPGPVLDLTYGRGLWWTRFRPDELIIGHGDFRDRPEVDGSVPVVCFDPPYISTGNRETSSVDEFYDRYGLGDAPGWRQIRQLIDEGLAECARILKPHGYLLVKCMDYVESGHKIWNTFHVYNEAETLGLRLVDRFIHVPTGKGGPQVTTNRDGSPREQKHAREVSSMLLVFTK
jgi:hypothetical protein